MSVDSDLFDTLEIFVDGRAYPNVIPAPDSGNAIYPVIRYTHVGTEIDPDLCGDGDADTVRYQIDIIDTSYAGAILIRDLVREGMRTHASPAVLEDSAAEYDAETKTHRIRMDYVIYLSSLTP
jgi:hypothetical protein